MQKQELNFVLISNQLIFKLLNIKKSTIFYFSELSFLLLFEIIQFFTNIFRRLFILAWFNKNIKLNLVKDFLISYTKKIN